MARLRPWFKEGVLDVCDRPYATQAVANEHLIGTEHIRKGKKTHSGC